MLSIVISFNFNSVVFNPVLFRRKADGQEKVHVQQEELDIGCQDCALSSGKGVGSSRAGVRGLGSRTSRSLSYESRKAAQTL